MFDSIKSRRLSDEIVRQIKDALFSGKLRAGDRLPTERELAQRFETSRASVREALRTLEPEGLIRVKKGVVGGIFIADGDHGPVARSLETLLHLRKVSIQQIAEVRLMFEPQAARLAAKRANAEDLRAMEQVIKQMTAALENKRLPRVFDLKFHLLVAQAARNPILEVLAQSMLGVASKTITDLKPSRDTVRHVVRCHREVFNAISRRDPEAAYTAMLEHIVDVQTRLARQARRQVPAITLGNHRHRSNDLQ